MDVRRAQSCSKLSKTRKFAFPPEDGFAAFGQSRNGSTVSIRRAVPFAHRLSCCGLWLHSKLLIAADTIAPANDCRIAANQS
jgi:hypothetical protein